MQGDYDEPDEMTEDAPAYPSTVRIAAIVWIVFGSIILFNGMTSFLVNAGNAAAVPKDAPPGAAAGAAAGGVCGVILVVLFGVAFIFVGYQTFKGTAKDTLGNAIGSIVMGLLCLACGGFGLVGALAIGSNPALAKAAAPTGAVAAVLIIVGIVYLFAGFALLGAGLLALVGREDYKAWRRWNKRRAGPQDD